MDVKRFESSPIGRLVPIAGYDPRFDEEYDHVAYVPDPLPKDVVLDSDTWKVAADAMLELGRLDDATSRFPNPLLLVRPALRREAVSTSALEGTFTDIEEVLAADVEDQSELPADVREVVNAITAMEFGLDAIKSGRALTVHLACELQEVLITGTSSDGTDTGRIRMSNVFIGRDDQRVHETRFIPSPHGPTLEGLFRRWEEWVRDDQSIQILVKCALAHYQFETIHPFHDGNGRVGRTLAILQLINAGAIHHPNLSISVWLQDHDEEYRNGLAELSATGDFDPWVRFFATAIAEQAISERDRVNRLLELRDGLVEQARQANLRGVAIQIAQDLIGFPYLRVPDVSERYNVSFQAANKAVGRLVETGLLKQVGERSYGRVFTSPKVVGALRV